MDSAQSDPRTATAYFLPDFLMPWAPAFNGPLPLAFSISSLRALASVQKSVRMGLPYIEKGRILNIKLSTYQPSASL